MRVDCPIHQRDAAKQHRRTSSKRQNPFERTRLAERQYSIQLRKIAEHIGHLVRGFPPGNPESDAKLQELLERYSRTLEPWAESTARLLVEEINARDRKAWAAVSADMSYGIQQEIQHSPVGDAMREFVANNVALIVGMPLEAAERVHKLSLEGIVNSERVPHIAKMIMDQGEVSKAHANTIALLGVTSTATGLTKARAEMVGSTHFEWITVGDAQVRPLHKLLNRTIWRWDDPPVADEATQTKALPGFFWGCRCFASPILADPYAD